jgi:hypothetical protein
MGAMYLIMKNLPRSIIASVLVTGGAYFAFSQGPLTPPGSPAPTMKTLDQVEARIIVNAVQTPGNATTTFIISAPGSYYFTDNITGDTGKHGISIQANDVTLDLNGFALKGGAGGLRGVDVPVAQSAFCIRNGSVRGWFGGGVRADAAVTLAENLRLSDNIGATGLVVGNGSMIKDCVASGNGTGFFAGDRTQISHCIATVNTSHGFDCTGYVNILDCTSSRNGGNGFNTLGGCSILRCSATRNLPNGKGILAGDGCTISDCTANNNGGLGIGTNAGSISKCTSNNNVGFGISTFRGSITNCTARNNFDYDIGAYSAVMAFCSAGRADTNNTTLTGNSITP